MIIGRRLFSTDFKSQYCDICLQLKILCMKPLFDPVNVEVWIFEKIPGNLMIFCRVWQWNIAKNCASLSLDGTNLKMRFHINFRKFPRKHFLTYVELLVRIFLHYSLCRTVAKFSWEQIWITKFIWPTVCLINFLLRKISRGNLNERSSSFP